MDNLSINNVVSIPDDIYSFKIINVLHISFLRNIVIPAKLSAIQIKTLDLKGNIAPEDEIKIKEQFPNTKLIINGQEK